MSQIPGQFSLRGISTFIYTLCFDYTPDHDVAVPQTSSIRLSLIIMFERVGYIIHPFGVPLDCIICIDFLESQTSQISIISNQKFVVSSCRSYITVPPFDLLESWKTQRPPTSTSEEASDRIPELTVVVKCETLTPKRPS